MFEAQLAYYLNRYLGTYVQGLDTKSLKISVFKGDVTLRNLKLKAEALADLNLPITVKAGLLGSLTLKVLILDPFLAFVSSVELMASTASVTLECCTSRHKVLR